MKIKINLLVILLFTTILNISGQNIDKNTATNVAFNYFSNISNRNNLCVLEVVENYYKDVLTFYAINFENGGYCIVSSDYSITPILSVSKSGYFIEIESLIPPKQYIFNNYSENIYSFIIKNEENSKNKKKWDFFLDDENKLNTDSVAPLTTTVWSQSRTNDIDTIIHCEGYNYFVEDTHDNCTNCANKCFTGCHTTAMGQVLAYWKYANYNGYNIYDWENAADALLYKTSPSSINPNFQNELYTIAHIIADCGTLSYTRYCTFFSAFNSGSSRCASFAWPKHIRSAMENIGYGNANLKRRTYYTDKKWTRMLKENIEALQPVIYTYLYIDSSISPISIQTAHTVVADGYYYNEATDDYIFHFNFGWGGTVPNTGTDGWFYIDSIFLGINLDGRYERMVVEIYPTVNQPDYCNMTIDMNSFYSNGGFGEDFEDYEMHTAPIAKNVLSPNFISPEEDRTISGQEDITYLAYEKIVLRRGFSVRQGGRFSARLVDCPEDNKQVNNYQSENKQYLSNETENNQSEKKEFENLRLEISPNPANSIISVNYYIPQETEFSLVIFDIFGQKVKELDSGSKSNGQYNENYDISFLPNGVYFCILKTSNGIVSKKIIKI